MTRDPETVSPEILVRTAFVRMRVEGFRHLLVEDGERLCGIVTDRDLRRPDISDEPQGWNEYYNLDSDYTVRDVMTKDPVAVRPDDRLETALALFAKHKIGALPVLEDDRTVGILTTDDALRAFAAVMKRAGKALRQPKSESKTHNRPAE